MSAFWFSLATLPTLKEVQILFPNVTVMAIMDDVTLMGKDIDVISAYEHVRSEWEKINLFLVREKSICVCDRTNKYLTSIPDLNIKLNQGHILLGAPIGTKDFKILAMT